MAPKQRSSGAAPAAPPPPLSIDPSSLLSDGISFTGSFPITIGQNTILHPRCKLNSTHGPISIGANCIISEKSSLVAPDQEGLEIGDYVHIEVNSVVHASKIGEGTTIEVGGKLGKGSIVGKNCTLSPLSSLGEAQILGDLMVIYGDNEYRKDVSNSMASRNETLVVHIQCLRKLLANKSEKYSRHS